MYGQCGDNLDCSLLEETGETTCVCRETKVQLHTTGLKCPFQNISMSLCKAFRWASLVCLILKWFLKTVLRPKKRSSGWLPQVLKTGKLYFGEAVTLKLWERIFQGPFICCLSLNTPTGNGQKIFTPKINLGTKKPIQILRSTAIRVTIKYCSPKNTSKIFDVHIATLY